MDERKTEERAVQDIMGGKPHYIQDSRGLIGKLLGPVTGKKGVYIVRELPTFDEMDMEAIPICGGLPLAAGAFALISYLGAGTALADEPKPETAPKKGYGVGLDGGWKEAQHFMGRLEAFGTKDGKRQYGDLVRLEHTEGADGEGQDAYGARVPVEFPFYTGEVTVFGDSDTEGGWGAGVGTDGRIRIPSLKEMIDLRELEIGAALERDRHGTERDLADIYAGAEVGPVTIKLGYGHVFDKAGIDQDILHGVGFLDFELPELGDHIVCLGGSVDLQDTGQRDVFLVAGRHGGDFGYRLIATSGLKGDWFGKLMIGDKGYIRPTFTGPADIWDGGMADRQIIRGVMDYKSWPPGLEAYSGSFGVTGAVSHAGGKTRGAAEAVLYPVRAARKLGADIEETPADGIWVGAGVKGIGAGPDRRLVGRIGYRHGCFDVYVQKAEGGPTELLVAVELR